MHPQCSGTEFFSHESTGCSSWFPPRELAALLAGKPVGEVDAVELLYPWPAHSAREWNEKINPAFATLRRTLAGWEEYLDVETNETFYCNVEKFKQEVSGMGR
ncbi:hypothetical protein ScalyP_jg417 [Parmales sp. scaly parma]|nr:hypothetical protein ScalyP_jg417 [Parmales sp. scaly parma]